MRRARRRAAGTFALALIGACFLLAPIRSDAVQHVNGDRVTLRWEPAPGPVARYGVYVSRDGAPFPAVPDHVTTEPLVTLSGDPATLLAVRVRAFDADGKPGPLSTASEAILFDEGAGPATGAFDFDGDGHSDLAVRDPESARVGIWLMGPDGPSQQASVDTLPTRWDLLSAVDVGGDGRADLLWRGDGAVHLWQMEGTTRTAAEDLALPPGMEPLLAADLDGDGRAELLARSDGSVGAFHLEAGALVPAWLLPGPAAAMSHACAADFDGDGQTDLLWSGDAVEPPRVWTLSAGRFVSERSLDALPPPGFVASACADADGDGHADVVWRDPAGGAALLWTLRDGALREATLLCDGDRLRALSIGDYDGDGLRNEMVAEDAGGSRAVRPLLDPGAAGAHLSSGPEILEAH